MCQYISGKMADCATESSATSQFQKMLYYSSFWLIIFVVGIDDAARQSLDWDLMELLLENEKMALGVKGEGPGIKHIRFLSPLLLPDIFCPRFSSDARIYFFFSLSSHHN